ncbi:MAG TPA: hypothetical protein VJU83_04320 [Burkholderiales bacterium]|nr:hypothetical protein [Burkholderiales bacterium]
MRKNDVMQSDAEMQVAQDYRRFLGEAEQLLHSARQLSGDSAALVQQRLADRVSQAKIRLEAARSHAAQRLHGRVPVASTTKVLIGAALLVGGAALATYFYKRHY